MAWYNNWSDLRGDIHHIVTGDPTPPKPVNNAAAIVAANGNKPVQIGSYSSAAVPGSMTNNQSSFGSDPVPGDDTSMVPGAPGQIDPNDPAVQQGMQAVIESTPSLSGLVKHNADGSVDWVGTIENIGGDALSAVEAILPKNKDGSVNWSAVASDAANIGNAIYQYQRQQQSDKYVQQGLALATQQYAANAPLRAQGIAGMENPAGAVPAGLSAQAPPLSVAGLNSAAQIATTGSGNPFASKSAPTFSGAPIGNGGLPVAMGGGGTSGTGAPPLPVAGATPPGAFGAPTNGGQIPGGLSTVFKQIAQSQPQVPQSLPGLFQQIAAGQGTRSPYSVPAPGTQTPSSGLPVAYAQPPAPTSTQARTPYQGFGVALPVANS